MIIRTSAIGSHSHSDVVKGPGDGIRGDLQGMRAIAVALVVFNHIGLRGFAGGYVGVDVFFVLSGFLITGLLLREARSTGSVSLGRFYMRRARRILPAALLTLVATDLAAYSLTNVVRAKQALGDSVWTAFFAANVHFAQQATNYFDRGQPASPVLHYWSLAVEEQFYLVWPALIGFAFLVARLTGRRGAVVAGTLALTITASSIVWSVHDTRTDPSGAYFSTLVRAWELGLGALLVFAAPALARVPQVLRAVAGWCGLGLIVYAAVSFSSATAFPGSAALVPTLGAALLIAAGLGAHARLAAGRMLSLAPFRWLGDRSYALYLWHWPILVLAAQYEDRPLSLGAQVILIAVAVALSAISYAFLEDPIRRHRWSGRTAIVLWPASIASALVVAVVLLHIIDAKIVKVPAASAASTALRTPADAALPNVRAAALAARSGAKLPSPLVPSPDQLANDHYQWASGCTADYGQTTSTTCFVGDTSSCPAGSAAGASVTSCPPAAGRKLIVVLGDSHAEMWMPTVLDMATADAWTVLLLAKSGCTPDTWTRTQLGKRSGIPSWSECHRWYEWAVATAKGLKPTAVILAGAYTRGPGTAVYVAGMANAATDAKRYARAVVAVGDTPRMAQDPTDCLLHGGNTLKSCAATYAENLWATDSAIATRLKAVHASFLSTRGWFCYQSTCPMVVGDTIVYRDTGHITTEYAKSLDHPFKTAVEGMILNQLAG